jgi:MoaA/NifB/PqqE/SkfB family radical SAM enzyme
MVRRENSNLDINMYQKFIDEIKTTTLHLLLYFQGEPFMNTDIFRMIKYASERRLYTVISSNGQFLDNETTGKIMESGLDRLIISVDGTDQSTYEQYREGGDLNIILENKMNALKSQEIARKSPVPGFQQMKTR